MAIWRPSRYLFDQRLSSPGASPSGGFAPLGRSALAIFHLLIRADRPIRPTAVATDASRSLPGSGSAHHYIALRLRGLSESPPRSRSAGVQADEPVREGRRDAAICRGARGSAPRSPRRSCSDLRFRRSDLVLSARRTLSTVDAAMAAIWGGVPQRNKNFTDPEHRDGARRAPAWPSMQGLVANLRHSGTRFANHSGDCSDLIMSDRRSRWTARAHSRRPWRPHNHRSATARG